MSGPTAISWAQRVAQKPAPSATQQAPAPAPASATTSSSSKDDSASTSTSTTLVSEVKEPSKAEAQESSSSASNSDIKKMIAATTFADEVPQPRPAATPRDDEASVAGSLATSAERNNKSSNSSSRGHDDSTPRKPRKPKRSRNAEKEERDQAEKTKEPEPEPIKAVELVEAPTPTVNIWQLRMQAAKNLPTPATSATMVNGAAKPSGTRSAAGVSGSAAETPTVNGSTSTNKISKPSAETPRPGGDQPKRTAARGSRVAEKDEKATVNGAVPVVADATSWPTPATVVEDKRPKAAPAKEQTEDDANPPKPAQKTTWKSMPINPTVNFETPMPNIKGSKPRGGGRGGRDASGRGAHSAPAGTQTADKTATNAVASPPKTSESRERKEAPVASTPGPNSAKRSSSDAANGREQRKSASPPNRDRRELAGADPTSKAETAARGPRNDYVNGDSAPLPRNPVGRRSPEYPGHAAYAPSKDGAHLNRAERGEERGGRGGRGGGHRGGRGGGHMTQGHPSQQPYAYNPRFSSNQPYQQQPGAPAYNSPPAQYGFNPAPPPQHGRGRPKSISGPTPPYGNGPKNNRGMPQVTTNVDPYQHPEGYQYPMSAGHTLNHEEFLVGIQQQVEFYFSAGNLVDDVFLKKNMDSQGFVPMSLIANFRRLWRITPTQEHLVWACQASEQIDFIQDDMGVDFLRARHIWPKYIQPWNDRDEKARNNGPDLSRAWFRSFHAQGGFYYPQPMPMPPLQYQTSPTFMGGFPPMTNGTEELYSPLTNGVQPMTNGNGHGASHQNGSQLSANVPDFAPSGSLGKGVTMEEFQKSSDAEFEQLTVNVSDIVVNGTDGSEAEPPSGETSKTSVPYPELRSRALGERSTGESSETPTSTRQLYYWWANNLLDNFNISAYETFRSSAMEDAKLETPRLFGIKRLLNFYKHLLERNAQSQLPSVFVQHRQEAEKALQAAKPVTNGTPQN